MQIYTSLSASKRESWGARLEGKNRVRGQGAYLPANLALSLVVTRGSLVGTRSSGSLDWAHTHAIQGDANSKYMRVWRHSTNVLGFLVSFEPVFSLSIASRVKR